MTTSMVWKTPNGRRPLVVDADQEERPRPWISVYPLRWRKGLFTVCWMCPTEEGGLVAKRVTKRDQAQRFTWAHRRCGFSLEPAPDPRAPDASMEDLVDQLEEPADAEG